MSYIWEHSKAREGSLLVMLAIGDFADDSGKAFPSVITLANKARLSERQTQYCLNDLVALGELSIERNKGPKGCNLYRVQLLQGAITAGVQLATGGVQLATPGGALHCTRTVSEPSTEPSEVIRPLDVARRVIEYLNRKTMHQYRGKINEDLVVARLKEGATEADCLRVIDNKVAEWSGDEKMSAYLRPSTLFGKSKFWTYEGAAAVTRQNLPGGII